MLGQWFKRKHGSCMVFLDEVDSLGVNKRLVSRESHGSHRDALNQLLTEIDGVEKNPEGLFIIAASNRPWGIDPALKRSGRIGECIYIPGTISPWIESTCSSIMLEAVLPRIWILTLLARILKVARPQISKLLLKRLKMQQFSENIKRESRVRCLWNDFKVCLDWSTLLGNNNPEKTGTPGDKELVSRVR